MSNALFCGAKPVNICPCSTYKIVPLSDSPLSSSTLNCTASLLLCIRYHHISFLHFPPHFIPLLSVFSFSLYFLSVSRGTGAPRAIVMATTMERQDGGVITGLASFTEGRAPDVILKSFIGYYCQIF